LLIKLIVNPKNCTMKKFHLFFLLMGVFVMNVMGQQKTITGSITDASGTPIVNANILNKNNGISSSSGVDGKFSITASLGHVLEITGVGFKTKTVTIDNVIMSVSLQNDLKKQDEIIVTAFGVKKQKRSLGYATQEIGAKDLTKERSPNFVGALQGKIAGVNIAQSGGTPGAGASIILRGIRSLEPGSNNQPLIIVDGLPISNSTVSGNVLPSAGSNSPSSSEQFSFTNRGFDINPDDIESISILKGAGATALYGLDGANGVVVITTKRGAPGKLTVSYNASITADKVTKYPEIQTKYREGFNGRLRFNSDGSPLRFQTYGPPVTNDPTFTNFRDFFDIGMRYMNTLSVSTGSDKYTLFGSASALNHKGIVPGTKLDRYNFRINNNAKLTDRLSVSTSLNFITSNSVKPSSGDKGVMSALSFHTQTFDVNDYLNADGSMKVYSPGIIDNPKYVGIYSTLKERVFRAIGNIGISYVFNKWLKADYRLGVDYYGEDRVRVVPGPRFPNDPSTLDIAFGQGGYVNNEKILYNDLNSTFLLTGTHSFSKDWDGSLTLGHAAQSNKSDYTLARGEKFALPFFYDISNTSNLFGNAQVDRRRLVGAFADAKIAYKNALFFNVTGRNDFSSTLPVNNRSFFYPSFSVSYVFTELHNIQSKVLSYGKLRLSNSQVGKDAPIYSVGQYYTQAPGFPFGSTPGFIVQRVLNDPELKPERTFANEVGLELKFLDSRLGIDATYYVQNSKDQIIRVPIAVASGYDNYITNAGEIQNKGVELTATGIILKKKDIKWDVNLNWSKNTGKVKSIKDGIQEIVFYGGERIINKMVAGGSTGDLYGRVYKRAADGQLLIRADGFPEIDQTYVLVGNAFPDWIGNFGTSFSYKSLTLSTLLEYKQGGDVYDVSLRNRIRNGIDKNTENRYQQVVFNGVTSGGAKNTVAVQLDDAFYRNENFYNGATEVLLQDASWFRIRNIALSYDMGKKVLSKLKFVKSISVSAMLNNILISTPFSGYDPEGTSFGSGSNAFGFMGFNIPNTSNFTFGLNVNF
jgi:TonB-linked SusC/RagA family outer membrane protein